jgi:hypothetical protein
MPVSKLESGAVARPAFDVRFTPRSGHSQRRLGCPLSANSGHWEVMTLDKVCKKKDAGQLRPASLTRHCARGDGHARGKGTPRGISERSEASA